MTKRFFCLAESVGEAQEDLMLLRLCLKGMMENHSGQALSELRCLWRISDYIEQHILDICRLLPDPR